MRKPRGDGKSQDDAPNLLDEMMRSRRRRPRQRPNPAQVAWAMRNQLSPARISAVFEHDGGEPVAERLYVPAGAPARGTWGLGWNGELLTVGGSKDESGLTGGRGFAQGWETRRGGLVPERRGGVPRVIAYRSIRGPRVVAEIAAVGNSEHVFWLVFLNERAERVAEIPAYGFDEPRLIHVADVVGVHYRRYLLDADTSAIPYLGSDDYFGYGTYFMPGHGFLTPLPDWISGRLHRSV
jgi:hypothetical protein